MPRGMIDRHLTNEVVIAGNELSGSGVGTSVSAAQYAQDMSELRSIIDTVYEGSTRRPLLVAPDGFFDRQWVSTFLNASGPGVLDVVTSHVYNLGPGLLSCQDCIRQYTLILCSVDYQIM